MYFYQITLRLNGEHKNEVRKTVTAPEFKILQMIHGHDAIHSVIETKNERVTHGKERTRLKLMYDKALARKKTSVDAAFGVFGNLPERLSDTDLEIFNIDGTREKREIVRTDEVSSRNRNAPVTEQEVRNLEEIVPADEVDLTDLLD